MLRHSRKTDGNYIHLRKVPEPFNYFVRDAAELLLSHPDVDLNPASSLLYSAAEAGKPAIMELLLQRLGEIDINREHHGLTPLYAAVR